MCLFKARFLLASAFYRVLTDGFRLRPGEDSIYNFNASAVNQNLVKSPKFARQIDGRATSLRQNTIFEHVAS